MGVKAAVETKPAAGLAAEADPRPAGGVGRTEAVIGHVLTAPKNVHTAVMGAKETIVAIARRPADTVAPAARVEGGADSSVLAAPGEKGPNTLSGGGIA